jgi:hypothetical protein
VHVFATDSKTPRRADSYDDQFIRRDDVSNRLDDMLKAWGRLCNDAPDVLARYFAAFYRDGEDPILHFLWNAVAMEELHKVASKKRKGVSFLDRLKQTVQKWNGAMESPVPDPVLEQIKDTRHYYAHGAGDLREAASKDWVLLRQAYFLEALATLEMLERLGFSVAEVVGVARKRYWDRENLGLKRFPE